MQIEPSSGSQVIRVKQVGLGSEWVNSLKVICSMLATFTSMIVRRNPERAAPKFRLNDSCSVSNARIWSLETRSGRLKSYSRISTSSASGRRSRVKTAGPVSTSGAGSDSTAASRASTSF